MKASVIVPIFNGGKTIKDCLGSLVSQSFNESFEIIVVDDGSTDNTVEIVEQFSGVKIVQQQNAGPAAARNNGARNASGEIVAFIDAEILARAVRKGYTIIQKPVHHYPRRAGSQTGANIRVILRAFKELFRLYRQIKKQG